MSLPKTHIRKSNELVSECNIGFDNDKMMMFGFAHKANGGVMLINEAENVTDENMYNYCKKCLVKAPLDKYARDHFNRMFARRR